LIVGDDTYILTSPLFDKSVIKHEKGTLTILSHNNSEENVIVEKIHLNGVEYNNRFISHHHLLNGDVTLEYWMKK
jgi:putative alpha-1,2-mannosidase